MLAAEPAGFLLNVTEFSVFINSMPVADRSRPLGRQLYRGPITDIQVTENTIIYTLTIPLEVPAQRVDGVALYSNDDIVAQGFITPRDKLFGSELTIYAYINAPEPTDFVEFRPLIDTPVATYLDYSDLDRADKSQDTEAVILNGHGAAEQQETPMYWPTMVTVGSAGTPLFAPLEPFSDPAEGSLTAPGTYTYYVTAYNGTGETFVSPPHIVTTVQLQAPTAAVSAGIGQLPSGTHFYQVVAVQENGAHTEPSSEVSVTTVEVSVPTISSVVAAFGTLEASTYGYKVAANSAIGTTTASAEQTVVITNGGAVIVWASVPNAVSYTVYRKRFPDTVYQKIVDVVGTSYTDWGTPVYPDTPLTTGTASGAVISWTKVEDADFYQIYGRTSGSMKGLLATVDGTVFSWSDDGRTPVGIMPTTNTTGTGLLLKWDAVENAVGYRVYGRETLIGLLADTTSLSWLDDGTVPPGTPFQEQNTTAPLEWQLVDGILLYDGTVSATYGTPVTAVSIPLVFEKWDIAMIYVVTGTAAGYARHVRYNRKLDVLEIIDKPITGLTVADTIRLWAATGQCGGRCKKPVDPVDQTEFGDPDVVIPPPDYSWLGVHFCGRLLGLPNLPQAGNDRDAQIEWFRQQPEIINSGVLEFGFCDRTGLTNMIPINNRIRTPYGNRLPVGDYADLKQACPDAHLFTLDSILVPPGIRIIIWTEKDFTGSILLDREGPLYLVNHVWLQDSRFAWALDTVVWNDRGIGTLFPQSARASTRGLLIPDMRLWTRGSVQIVKT